MWARQLEPGWQAKRRAKALGAMGRGGFAYGGSRFDDLPAEEKIRRQENANIDAMMRIHRRIDEVVEDRETAESLKPWYMLMCKRPCFHNDYLPSFNRPNVHLVDTRGRGVTLIDERGPTFDGRVYEVDLLIYATGFEVQKTGIYNRIVGKGGLELNDKYQQGIQTLFGIHSHGFPNLFIMGGYQAPFQFNLTYMLQTTWRRPGSGCPSCSPCAVTGPASDPARRPMSLTPSRARS
jgi:cation diffusion facilitator CzcD-associated flavoprotein CzcO